MTYGRHGVDRRLGRARGLRWQLQQLAIRKVQDGAVDPKVAVGQVDVAVPDPEHVPRPVRLPRDRVWLGGDPRLNVGPVQRHWLGSWWRRFAAGARLDDGLRGMGVGRRNGPGKFWWVEAHVAFIHARTSLASFPSTGVTAGCGPSPTMYDPSPVSASLRSLPTASSASEAHRKEAGTQPRGSEGPGPDRTLVCGHVPSSAARFLPGSASASPSASASQSGYAGYAVQACTSSPAIVNISSR